MFYEGEYDWCDELDSVEESMFIAEYEEYANKVINVMCDICDNDGRGTMEGLQQIGWAFVKGAEFCPSH